MFNAGPVFVDGVSGPVDFGLAPVVQERPPGGGYWPVAVLLYVGIAALAIFGASQSISPTRRWRWRRRGSRSEPAEATTDG
jgi:hypothetical protein